MKKLLLAIIPILMMQIVLGATINPNSLTLTTQPGNTTSGVFTLTLSNETCSPTVNSTFNIYGLPSFENSTGSYKITFYVPISTDTAPGSYVSTIKYCNAVLNLQIKVNPKTTSESCPTYLKIYGEKIPGKTIKFDLRNSNYERIRNPDTTITIESSDTGNTYEVDCPEGSCTWQIPQTEKGTLMFDVIVPKCTPISSQIELKPAGKMEVSVPSKINKGEDFYIYVFDPMKGALPYVNVQIIYPDGQVFNGKTNENGIVCDESMTKIYGKDILPDSTGIYKIYVNQIGYGTVNKTFSIVQTPCPYQCCINQPGYTTKECQSGYKCQNNTCVKIVQPKIIANCTNLVVGKQATCVLLADGKRIKEDIAGTLKFKDKTVNVTFSDGVLHYTFDKPGQFEIDINATGYKYSKIVGEIKPPSINATPFIIIFAIVIAGAITFVIYKMRFSKKTKINWDITPETSFPVEE